MLKCLYVDPMSVCADDVEDTRCGPMTDVCCLLLLCVVCCVLCVVSWREGEKKRKKAFRLSFHSATNLYIERERVCVCV